ncbi:MAG: hypothetical protein J0I96_04490 [Rhodanobacter sp.]|nr:hypothetical protein [Rhodanobacter sp.]
MPPLLSAASLPAVDAWIRVAIAKYTALVTTQRAEHACSAELRAKGVIR